MKKAKLFKVMLSGALLGQTALSFTTPITVLAAENGNSVTHESLTEKNVAAPNKDKVIPSLNQYKYQKDELAAFCHFGPNTFTGKEWGDDYGNKKPQDIFWLDKDFDAETLVKTLKDAGFTKLIVTAKHHDGFCIWESKETDYDMGSIQSYKEGKGDILKEISAACSQYDMDMGLYLSPWDIHDKSYGYKDEKGNALVHEVMQDGKKVTVPKDNMTWTQVEEKDVYDYNKYYDDQLIEILGNDAYGNKGHFTEVWMDGAKGSGTSFQNYDFGRWYETIQKYEGKAGGQKDDCLLFGAQSHTTVRWIGNEHGHAANETWSKSRVDTKNDTIDSNSKDGYTQGYVDGNQWTVPEADARITSGWFWGNSKKTPKTMEALSEMYFRSVGHNAPLLLNIPPNNEGKVDVAILNRVTEFGKNIRDSFKTNLAQGATVYASNVRGNDVTYSPLNVLDDNDATYWTVDDNLNSGSLTLKLKETTTFDVVSIEEAIEFGQRIGHYKVEYRKTGENWTTFEEGPTVGAKRLCRKKPVTANEVRITVTAHGKAEIKTPMLNAVGLYKVTPDMALKSGVPEGLDIVDNTKFTAEGWHQTKGDQLIESTGMWSDVNGQTAEVKFNGTKAWLLGTVDTSHGTADIYLDGQKVTSINTKAPSRKLGQVLYTTPDLADGEHTLKVVNTGSGNNKAIGLDALAHLNNGGKGLLQIEYPTYTVNEATTMPIKVQRVGGAKGETQVQFQVNPGSAWQDHFNADGNMTLTFKDGQTEAMASITTNRVPGATGDLNFSMELVEPTNGVLLGFNNPSMVTILDTESFNKEILKTKIEDAIAANYRPFEYTNASYEAFSKALEAAQDVYNTPNATRQACAKAASDLDIAIKALTKRATFTTTDSFIFPSRMGDTKVLEAEFAILDSSNATNPDNYVRIQKAEGLSNGAKVGWFEPGNKITIPFEAKKAGIYTFTIRYESGRPSNNPNEIVLKCDQFKETTITKEVTNKQGETKPSLQTISFDVEIMKPGAGEMIFEANEKASPNLDKIDITAKDVAMENYTITTASEGEGTISETTTVKEGSSSTITFTPSEGQTVQEVYVDGKGVGPCLSYTFENVSKNHTIKAIFALKQLTSEHPFQFPTLGQTSTAEAERFELKNVGENEQWPLQVKQATWASMGEFVNSMNGEDTVNFYYNAKQPGNYDVTLVYRSGSEANHIVWTEQNQKVKAGNIVAGNKDSNVTKEIQFTMEVLEAGPGVITFSTDEKNAPQMDRFIITNNQDPLQLEALANAIADAEALDLDLYEDGQAKESFKVALNEAKEVLNKAQNGETTQASIDKAYTNLTAAREALRLIPQTPIVDKVDLQKVIEEAQAIDLDLMKDGAAKDYFKEALKSAITVLEDENANETMVQEAKTNLIQAMEALERKPSPEWTPPTEEPTPDSDVDGSKDEAVPNTGDNTQMIAYITLLFVSMMGLATFKKEIL